MVLKEERAAEEAPMAKEHRDIKAKETAGRREADGNSLGRNSDLLSAVH